MADHWADRPWLLLDTETTGTDPFDARIVEVATAVMDPTGTVVDSWSRIVDPGVPIPQEAVDVHGIDNDRAAAEGISPPKALNELAVRIWEHLETFELRAPVVMFKADYDWPLAMAEAERHQVEVPLFAPVLDPLLIDRMLDKDRRGRRRLTLVLGEYDVPIAEIEATGAHGALADAIAAGHVMRQIVHRYPEIRDHTLPGVWLRQVHGHEKDRLRFVDWKRCNQDPTYDAPAGWPVPVERTQAPDDDPRPPAEPAVKPRDVAKRAAVVFATDYEAAPRGRKVAILTRLRHAVIWTATKGARASSKDCSSDELARVMRVLDDIADGRITYRHEALNDNAGVTFTLLRPGHPEGDKAVDVLWADIEARPKDGAA